MEENRSTCTRDIGGQAVIEGVMMRGARSFVVAVRKPNQEITVLRQELIPLKERFSLFKLPIIRGLAVLIESLTLGIKALSYSANVAVEEEGKEKSSKEIGNFAMAMTFIFSLVLGIGLFVILPERLANLISDKGYLFNIVDGVIRLIIFFLYIILISQSKQIARVFQYHGAEHKSIHTYEAGEELTEENAIKYSPLHPRCGTAFLLTVMVISILVFSIFGKPESVLVRIGSRLVLIPLIAGISYELIKFTSKRQDNIVTKIIIAPGLWLQRLTTKEPTVDQIQVAIRSLKEVLQMENLQVQNESTVSK
ncbi:TPA: DUF1385 domain-containing protein [Candidatus Poribacteria bacterium]|nr:DUF1385 domain-containing protein [Candidatus Poribacteria bacterium]